MWEILVRFEKNLKWNKDFLKIWFEIYDFENEISCVIDIVLIFVNMVFMILFYLKMLS